MQSLSVHWELGQRSGSPSWTTHHGMLPSSAERPVSCSASNRGSSRASGRWETERETVKNGLWLWIWACSSWFSMNSALIAYLKVSNWKRASLLRLHILAVFYCNCFFNHKRAVHHTSALLFHLLDTDPQVTLNNKLFNYMGWWWWWGDGAEWERKRERERTHTGMYSTYTPSVCRIHVCVHLCVALCFCCSLSLLVQHLQYKR